MSPDQCRSYCAGYDYTSGRGETTPSIDNKAECLLDADTYVCFGQTLSIICFMKLQNLLSVLCTLMKLTTSTVTPCCASSNMFQLALVGMIEVNQLS